MHLNLKLFINRNRNGTIEFLANFLRIDFSRLDYGKTKSRMRLIAPGFWLKFRHIFFMGELQTRGVINLIGNAIGRYWKSRR